MVNGEPEYLGFGEALEERRIGGPVAIDVAEDGLSVGGYLIDAHGVVHYGGRLGADFGLDLFRGGVSGAAAEDAGYGYDDVVPLLIYH